LSILLAMSRRFQLILACVLAGLLALQAALWCLGWLRG
jgi:hypothetical protein